MNILHKIQEHIDEEILVGEFDMICLSVYIKFQLFKLVIMHLIFPLNNT